MLGFKKRFRKKLAKLSEHKYKCLLGSAPDLVYYLKDEEIHVVLGKDADYINLSTAIDQLQELVEDLKDIQEEIEECEATFIS